MKISLIAVDLDGTLLTGDKKLAPKGAESLRRLSQQNIRVILSTARDQNSTRIYCAEMDLNDPIICFGGAQVWSAPNGELWSYAKIHYEAASAIAQYADEQGWELSITIEEMTYWKQRPGQSLGPVSPNRNVLESNSAALRTGKSNETAQPVRIMTFDPAAIAGLADLCQDQFSHLCRPEIFFSQHGQPESLAIFPKGADKGTALQLILDRLKIPSQEVMAIGDNLVDLPMFDLAYLSVAMGNSPPKVKQRAAALAPSNEQEGVAWAINEFIFNSTHT